MPLDVLSLQVGRSHARASSSCLTIVKTTLYRQCFAQVDDEEELKRAALDNITKSQRTFKYPIKETEDENGKVSTGTTEACPSMLPVCSRSHRVGRVHCWRVASP